MAQERLEHEALKNEILDEFHGLEPKSNFLNRVYYIAIYEAKNTRLSSLNSYYQILKNGNNFKLAENFKKCVEREIIKKIDSSSTKPVLVGIKGFYLTPPENNDVFYEFAKNALDNFQVNSISESYLALFNNSYNNNQNNNTYKEFIDNFDKKITKTIMWAEIEDNNYRKEHIIRVINHPRFTPEKKQEVLNWVIELLHEKIIENPESKIPIKLWLEQTNNLKEF